MVRPAAAAAGRCLGIAAIGLGLSGCGAPYPALTGRYAADEITAAGELAPMGRVAYRLCREQAAYALLAKAQQSDVEPPVWPRWYGEAPGSETPTATGKATWMQTCDESAKAAEVVHTLCRGLRAHGKALALLASGSGQPLDTGAIEDTTNLVLGEVAAMNATSAIGKAASQAGSAFATASKIFLDVLRLAKLEQVVRETETAMDSTFDHLLQVQGAMAKVLADVEQRRSWVVQTIIAGGPPPRGADRSLALAEAMDAVGETDHALKVAEEALTTYKTAIAKLKAAYSSLAKLAVVDPKYPETSKTVSSALDALESSLQDLTELER